MSHENIEGRAFRAEGSVCAKALYSEEQRQGHGAGAEGVVETLLLAGDEVRQVEETRSSRAGIATAGQIQPMLVYVQPSR